MAARAAAPPRAESGHVLMLGRAAVSRQAAARSCGRGRETNRLPAALKRQCRSVPLVIPTRGPRDDARLAPRPSRSGDPERLGGQRCGVLLEADAEGLGELPRPGAELVIGSPAAPLPHRRQSDARLERPDQHRGRVPIALGDRVQHAVDPVGDVDVGQPRRAEEDLVASGAAAEGVTGGIVAVVALGLDDHPAAITEQQGAADQLPRHPVHGAGEERGVERLAQERSSATRALTASSVSRAKRICRSRLAEPVPPSTRFDSSQLSRRSSS